MLSFCQWTTMSLEFSFNYNYIKSPQLCFLGPICIYRGVQVNWDIF
uniref:Uncharacterized protein n=1 Tax=Lepeophtheirus salmonis TaxID=72036 RepID=A0A0K2V6R2_LEPSM